MIKQRRSLFLMGFLFMLFCVQGLCAFSVTPKENPYWKNGVLWQKVEYKNNETGYTTAFPGGPFSKSADGNVFVYSQYNSVLYMVSTSINERYTPPKTKKEFIQILKDTFSEPVRVVEVTLKKSAANNVKYAADVYFRDKSMVIRVLSSKNCLYVVTVYGDDLSQAKAFFDKIRITK